jgi:Calpain family cysteine protease
MMTNCKTMRVPTVLGLVLVIALVGRSRADDEPGDVRQGDSPTCVLMSTLAAMSNAGMNPSKMIRAKGGSSYEVSMFKQNGTKVRVSVEYSGPEEFDPCEPENNMAWPAIIQRAYGQLWRVRDGNFGSPGVHRGWVEFYSAAEMLTGNRGYKWNPMDHSESCSRNMVLTALHDALPVAVGMGKDTGGLERLVPEHAYTVLSADEGGLTLRNPWGHHKRPLDLDNDPNYRDGRLNISWENLRDLFHTGMIVSYKRYSPGHDQSIRCSRVYRTKAKDGEEVSFEAEFESGEMDVEVYVRNGGLLTVLDNISDIGKHEDKVSFEGDAELEVVCFVKADPSSEESRWVQARYQVVNEGAELVFKDTSGRKRGSVKIGRMAE